MLMNNVLRRSLARLALVTFGAVVLGSAVVGVQTLFATPLVSCEDPLHSCALGGDPRCHECCEQLGHVTGQCVSGGTICLCEG